MEDRNGTVLTLPHLMDETVQLSMLREVISTRNTAGTDYFSNGGKQEPECGCMALKMVQV